MTGRNVRKQRDDAMKLLREGADSVADYVTAVMWRAKARKFLRRFEVEEQKKQAHTQRNGVKK